MRTNTVFDLAILLARWETQKKGLRKRIVGKKKKTEKRLRQAAGFVPVVQRPFLSRQRGRILVLSQFNIGPRFIHDALDLPQNSAGSFVEVAPRVPRSSCHRGGSIPLLSMLDNFVVSDLGRQVEAERIE